MTDTPARPRAVVLVDVDQVERNLGPALGHVSIEAPGGLLAPWLAVSDDTLETLHQRVLDTLDPVTVDGDDIPVGAGGDPDGTNALGRWGHVAWTGTEPDPHDPDAAAWLATAAGAVDLAADDALRAAADDDTLAWPGRDGAYDDAHAVWALDVVTAVADESDRAGGAVLADHGSPSDRVRDAVRAATRRHLPAGWDDFDVRHGTEILGTQTAQLLGALAPHARHLVDVSRAAGDPWLVARLADAAVDPAHVLDALDGDDPYETLAALASLGR